MSISSENKKETLRLRKSGKYPIANLEIFESIYDLSLDDFILEQEDEVKEKYNEYIDNLLNLSYEKRKSILDTFKKEELIKNQELEGVDSFDAKLRVSAKRESALDYLFNKKDIVEDDIIKAHQLILKGTDSDVYCRRKYRKENTVFVSNSGNVPTRLGEPDICYFAIDCEDIPEALERTVNYYHSNLHRENTFIKPIITHALIAGLQMFNDGNSRLARTVHNVELYDLCRLNERLKLKKSPLYISGSYVYEVNGIGADYREQYRNKIADLIINEDDENWNKWINFNLNRIEDQINFNNNEVLTYAKKKTI